MEAIDLLREHLQEQRADLKEFMKDYHQDQVEIWKKIQILETKQKMISGFYGILGGLLPAMAAGIWIVIRGM